MHSQVSHLGSLSLGDTIVSRCFQGTLGKTKTITQLHCPVFEDVSLVGLYTLCLLACQVGVTVGNSNLCCCCVCMMSSEC